MKGEFCDKVLDLSPFSVYVFQSLGRGKPGKPKNITCDLAPAPDRYILQGFRIDDFFSRHPFSSNFEHGSTIQETEKVQKAAKTRLGALEHKKNPHAPCK
jgi:hypothetical protein